MQLDRTSLSVAQRRNFTAYPLRNSLRELSYGSPPPPKPQTAPAAGVDESRAKGKVPPPKSAAGFLLLDSSLNPICLNAEAMQILSYPDKFVKDAHPSLVAEKIRSSLISQQSSGESPFATEFRSGRRHYFCRAFVLDSNAKDTSHPSIAVLLERGPSELTSLPQVSQQFDLTQREQEALEYLLHGLSSKEIANRMNISPNTVKAFLRLIMIKTGVSSRTAIPWKIIRGRA